MLLRSLKIKTDAFGQERKFMIGGNNFVGFARSMGGEEEESVTETEATSSTGVSGEPELVGNPCVTMDCCTLEEASIEEEIAPESLTPSHPQEMEADAASCSSDYVEYEGRCSSDYTEYTPPSRRDLEGAVRRKFSRLRGYTGISGTVSTISLMISGFPKCMEMEGGARQDCGIVALVLISLLSLTFLILYIFLYSLERRELKRLKE
ncbi:hypothetical protein [Candidatus Ichthyocystis hellenicum]|uniref:hypothetical protein n=1 Tax=Candidatus Ichthyocystis hellenicum TaxID=1561003 RepID=UPI001112B8F5|nr:hypothetical protein [Candidatus Ichthyocystis hellenicum]